MTFSAFILPFAAITTVALVFICAVIDYRNAKEEDSDETAD